MAVFCVVIPLCHGPIATLMEDVCKCVLCNRSGLGSYTSAVSTRSVYCSVDDLSIFPGKNHLHVFFINTNSIQRNLAFMQKLEISDFLHFIDVQVFIEKAPDGCITRTYKKSTHTGLYSTRSSFVPFHRKGNTSLLCAVFIFLFSEMLFSKVASWVCTW